MVPVPAWSVVVTALGSVLNPYAALQPAGAIGYLPFLGLRFLTVLHLVAGAYVTYWLLHRGLRERIYRDILLVGTVIAIIALYIYVAQVYRLPEPTRSRLGTDGLAQTASFSYAFHRATGTFREPSMLAAWLITPLFLSMSSSYRRGVLYSAVIGSVILLTGSLTGVAANVIGAMFGLVFVGGVGSGSFRVALRFALVLILGFAVFRGVAISHTVHRADLFGVLSDRVSFLVHGGFAHSDRDYIYRYVATAPKPLFGPGFGNRNLLFSRYLGVHLIASFVSMYLSVMYSVGIFGLALLVFCLVTPLVQIWFSPVLRRSRPLYFAVAAYVAWLVVFFGAVEELTLMFAITLAVLHFRVNRDGKLG